MFMNGKNFVKTTDSKTAEYLRKAGFVELEKEGNRFVFLNEIDKANFSDEDLKLSFSDILCV